MKACKYNRNDIMAPCNKHWNDFCWELDAHVGLSKMEETGTFTCNSDHKFTTEVLTRCAPYINLKETIELLEEKGGYCDCEVLFNVMDQCEGCKHIFKMK